MDAIEQCYLKGIERLRHHIRKFEATHGPRGQKLPRATDWRPYRFAIQDVIFFITVMRHAKESNSIAVDVLLTAEIEGYERLAGAKAAALMLLSEAFRVGSAMSLRFSQYVEGGKAPIALQQLAKLHNVTLGQPEKGIISHEEGRRLYFALTGFPPHLENRIRQLEQDGLLSMERACYMIHHGVWTVPEVEGIICGSPYPDLVLTGDVSPEHFHLFRHVQMHARAALLGGYLDRALAQRNPDEKGVNGEVVGRDGEDDERHLSISFEPDCYARRYRCAEEPVPLPSWHPPPGLELSPGKELVALLRPRDATELRRYLATDIKLAAKLSSPPQLIAVVVPFDFNDLPEAEQSAARVGARKSNVCLLVCPETTKGLDADLNKKLARSRILRD